MSDRVDEKILESHITTFLRESVDDVSYKKESTYKSEDDEKDLDHTSYKSKYTRSYRSFYYECIRGFCRDTLLSTIYDHEHLTSYEELISVRELRICFYLLEDLLSEDFILCEICRVCLDLLEAFDRIVVVRIVYLYKSLYDSACYGYFIGRCGISYEDDIEYIRELFLGPISYSGTFIDCSLYLEKSLCTVMQIIPVLDKAIVVLCQYDPII